MFIYFIDKCTINKYVNVIDKNLVIHSVTLTTLNAHLTNPRLTFLSPNLPEAMLVAAPSMVLSAYSTN
jgi:hypothetical protein